MSIIEQLLFTRHCAEGWMFTALFNSQTTLPGKKVVPFSQTQN